MTRPLKITRGPDTGGVQFKVAEPFDGQWIHDERTGWTLSDGNGPDVIPLEGRLRGYWSPPGANYDWDAELGRWEPQRPRKGILIAVAIMAAVYTLIALMAKAVAS